MEHNQNTERTPVTYQFKQDISMDELAAGNQQKNIAMVAKAKDQEMRVDKEPAQSGNEKCPL